MVIGCVSSKVKVGFGFNHEGFSGITIGAMSSKFISEFSKCVFTRSPNHHWQNHNMWIKYSDFVIL
jgi:hypothetical protein